MGLRINTNVAALMAQRNLARADQDLTTSLERLSSGLRINRAADDPSGLVISEQQRAQIAGLNQAAENSERAVSMVQTAEGQLAEVNSLLIKIRGLVLDAANSAVNDANSLAADQSEIEDAIATIDRIATTAQFGSKLLFDGSNANSVTSTANLDATLSSSSFATGVYTMTVDAATFQEATYGIDATGAAAIGLEDDPGAGNYDVSGLTDGSHTVEVTTATAAGALTGSTAVAGAALTVAAATNDNLKLTVTRNGADTSATLTLSAATYTDGADLAAEINAKLATSALNGLVTASATDGKLVFTTADEGSGAGVRIVAATANDWLDSGGTTGFAANDVAYGTDGAIQLDGHANTVSYVSSGTATTKTVHDVDGNTLSLTLLSTGLRTGSATMTVAAASGEVHFGSVTAVAFTAGNSVTLENSAGETVKVAIGLSIAAAGSDTVTVTNNSLMFQIGPNAAQTARIGLPELTTTVLGNNISGNQFASLYEIDVTTFDKATDALEIVDDVVNQISTLRGELGSFQANTLESNLAALRVTAENLIAAESVIRDTDFSVEVANFTKQQILRQAGGTVLTNAAQAPQLVLQLLR